MAYKPSDTVGVGGVFKKLTEWAVELGTPVQTILGRLKRGQSVEQACSNPIKTSGGANRGKTLDADVLSADEVERLLSSGSKSATFVRDRVLIVLAYRSGLRCAEILALMTKDLDISRGTISVHHGKGDKARVVALDPQAWAHVAEWMQLRATWAITDTTPLFCTQEGGRLSDRQVRAMFSRRARKAKIEKHVHPHGMRRTMASEMAAEGIPLIDISGALGHSNIATTNTYLKKVNPTSVVDAMRSRAWGTQRDNVTNVVTSAIPCPDWLPRLRADIGERLMLVHDARGSETEFKAVVLLF